MERKESRGYATDFAAPIDTILFTEQTLVSENTRESDCTFLKHVIVFTRSFSRII